ncbi:MAG: NADH-quinone oxidoreductase subunit F, partial [Desulfobacterota bacterium]|nr:NADH-quinone oxidoreductase subunit F [Thermodesulfobacteriota bacterium]
MSDAIKNSVQKHYKKIKSQAEKFWQESREGEKTFVLVGTATCGRASGSLEVLKSFKEEIAQHNLNAQVISVGCLGHCYAEPLVIIRKPDYPSIIYPNVSPPVVNTLVKHFLLENNFLPELMLASLESNDFLPSLADFPRFSRETRIILQNFGIIDPENIWDYIARGGYEGLHLALQLKPEEIIKKLAIILKTSWGIKPNLV